MTAIKSSLCLLGYSWVGDHAQGLGIFLYLFGAGSISILPQLWQSSGLTALSPDLIAL